VPSGWHEITGGGEKRKLRKKKLVDREGSRPYEKDIVRSWGLDTF